MAVEWKKKAEQLGNRLSKLRAQGEVQMGIVKTTAIVGGVGAALGYMSGRMADTNPEYELMGVRIEVLTAMALHGAGFVMGSSAMAKDMHSAGDGAVAVALYEMARDAGVAQDKKSNDAAPVGASWYNATVRAVA